MVFEPNQGQAEASVQFLARGRGYGLFLTPTEAVLVLAPSTRVPSRGASASLAAPLVVRMRLLGADAGATIAGSEPLSGRSHYLLGQADRWQRAVPTFARVRYTDVYPGISLVFYGTDRQLEYDFIVAPGANPDAVALAFDGVEGLHVDSAGDLVLATGAGDLRLRRPVIYQEVDGERRPVDGGYVVDGNRVRFRMTAWDPARPLVIDPILAYSTFLGGSSTDQGFGITVDASGNAYVTGSTISTNFPVSSPLQATRLGVTDAFVTKLDSTGALVFSTFLGGSGDDAGNAIAVDASGNVLIAGTTTSGNFPVQGAAPFAPFQSTLRGGNDAFVAKLDPTGGTLVYSTYLGSNTDDFGTGIAVDALGNAYVTGSTQSVSFPNNGAVTCLGTKSTGADAFVAKLDPSGVMADGLGTPTGYCRFLGGPGVDSGEGIVANTTGNVWVVGSTTSTDIGIAGAAQASPVQATSGGQTDGFVGKLNPAGALVYLTFLGGSGDDFALGVAVDAAGNAYVTGSTDSPDFPTQLPLQQFIAGGDDAFVAKVNPAGSALVFSTYLGGTADDVGNAIGVHLGDSSVYVAGSTKSVDFPTVAPIQPGLGGRLDAFVTRLNPAGGALLFSTYLGGAGDDVAQAIAVDQGLVYLTGSTNSVTFPTAAPIQGPGGLLDAFVTQIAEGGTVQFTASSYQVSETAGSATITVQRVGDTTPATTVQFATSNGTATAGSDYTTASGTLTFSPGQIIATFTVPIINTGGCDGDETVNLTLSNASGSVLGTRSSAVLTILDPLACIAFGAAEYSVDENHGPAVITVTRSGSATGVATVRFQTINGTATAPADYTAIDRTLTFSPGVRSLSVPIAIVERHARRGTGDRHLDAVQSGRRRAGNRAYDGDLDDRGRRHRRDPVLGVDLHGGGGDGHGDDHGGPKRRPRHPGDGGLRDERWDGDGGGGLHRGGADPDVCGRGGEPHGDRADHERHRRRGERDRPAAAHQSRARGRPRRPRHRHPDDRGQRRGGDGAVQPGALHGAGSGPVGADRDRPERRRRRRERSVRHQQRAGGERGRGRGRLHDDERPRRIRSRPGHADGGDSPGGPQRGRRAADS